MDQDKQKQLQVQGAFDALKTINDGLSQQLMNLQGANYVLSTQLQEAQAQVKELEDKLVASLKAETPDATA